MAYLGECLRGAGTEAVAVLLDGVPEDRPLDVEALKAALSSLSTNCIRWWEQGPRKAPWTHPIC